MHVCGDVSNSKYRAIYFMNAVMVLTYCRGLHTACM